MLSGFLHSTMRRGYSTPRPNRFDFGSPCASRPASARLPRQSVNSFQLMLWSRPAESFPVNPALESKVPTSDSPPPLHFSSRTPRPPPPSAPFPPAQPTTFHLLQIP